jgi:Rad3-related DNA helicase
VVGSDSDVRRQAVMLQLSPEKHYCPYWKQLQMCRDSGVSLFNFSSFLYQQRLARFPKRRLLIIDEAHNIESQLMSYVTVELTEWALSIINVEIDKEITSKEQFSEWLREKEVMGKIGRALEEGDGEDPESTFEAEIDEAQAEALRDLQGKLENFIAFLDKTEWILETVSYEKRGQMTKKVVARPLYAKGFAEDLLFRHAERVLVMSATFLDMDVWCDSLGISRDEVEHVEIGCDFPVKNRPIFLSYAGNCARKYLEETKPKLVQMVKAILNKHEGQRGIIHSHSFDLQDLMRRGVASDRFLFQQDFPDKAAMLEEHARKEGSVIVAPAMSEGLDLKDDLGRFQILLKVPWPSLGDKVVKERAARDGRWYGWLTALKATQSFGRIVRGCDDWGHTYIVDSGWEWFVKQHGHMIPDWVRAAFRKGVLS